MFLAAELEATDDILQWNWERGILLELHNCSIARLVFGLMASRDHPSLDPFILAVSDMRPSPAADEVIFAIVRRFHLSINAKTAHAVVRLIKKSVLRAPLRWGSQTLFSS